MTSGLIGWIAEPGAAAMVDLAVRGTLLLAAAGVAALALRRAPASARHLAWGAAFAGMLALPVLATALPAWRVPILPAAEAAGAPAAAPTAASLRADRAELQDRAAARENRASTAPATASPRAEAGARDWRWMAMAAALFAWLAGAGLALLRLMGSLARVRREGRTAVPLTAGPAAEMLDRLVWRMEIDQPVLLLQGAADAMPLTWGVRQPRVLLPSGTESWPSDRLEAVLTHELAHVRRRDCAWQLVAEAACALHWFNPLAWAAARRLRLESEHACDDQVLLAGSAGADYAGHLLDVARTLRPPRPTVLAGVPMARPSQLRTRLQAVLSADRARGSVPFRVAGPALLGSAALVVLLAAFTPARARPAGLGPGLAAVACDISGPRSHETDLNLGGAWTVSWGNGDACGGSARIEGDVRFTPGFGDVASIAPGGMFRVEMRDGDARTRVEVRPGEGGLVRTFRTGGREEPWSPAAQRWLAAALPELMRHTTYAREQAAAPPGAVPRDDVRQTDATTILVHQDRPEQGSGSEALLLAKDVTLTADRAGFDRFSADGYVVFRENLIGGRVRRVEIRPGADALRYAWSGDFDGVDRDAWMARMFAYFADQTRPQRRW